MPSGAAPFVGELCSVFVPGSPDHWRFLDTIGKALLSSGVLTQLFDTSTGAMDYALLTEECDHVIAERAAATLPPTAPLNLRPAPSTGYSPYQQALSSFRNFCRLPLARPPPLAPPTDAAPPRAVAAVGFSSGGKPTTVHKSCPTEAKGVASNGCILLDRVATDAAMFAQLSSLDQLARTRGAEAMRAELERASPDVRALLTIDVEHLDVGNAAMQAGVLLRNIARVINKGARSVLTANETLVVDASQAPNPQHDLISRHLSSGSLHLITEFMLSGAPSANKHKLFFHTQQSGASLAEYNSMDTRVRIVLEAFGKTFPAQQISVDSFLLNFRKIAKTALDMNMPIGLLFDFVWVPFWREYAMECLEARESPGRSHPFILPSRLAESGPFASRLLNAHFRLMSKGSSFLRSSQIAPTVNGIPPPPPYPHLNPPHQGKAPPPGSIACWNPQKKDVPGWFALPSNRPPHNPKDQDICRGWKGKGLCAFGQNCHFKHPGY